MRPRTPPDPSGRRARWRRLALLLGLCLAAGCADSPTAKEVESCTTGPRFARLLADGRCPDRYLAFSAAPVDTERLCVLAAAPEPLGCLIECSTVGAVITCGVRLSDGVIFYFPYVTMFDLLEADGTFRACTAAERSAWDTAYRQPCP